MSITGYPSKDKPWLKYYGENAEAEANNIPENKTVWDVIEERLNKYIEIPAIEFFGRTISRQEFIDEVYLWAKAFKGLGVQEDEVIPYYGVFTPDVCAMTFALNIIGACPYFLKLAIGPKALSEETKDSRFAIVFDQMWGNVKDEFSKDRFEKVIIVRITDAMPMPKKQIVSVIAALKSKNSIPKNGKYISVSEAKKFANGYIGEVKVPFVSERPAFITSSSGTTVDGVVKGCVATNESTVAQLIMEDAAHVEYHSNDRVLNHFPPTASTSLNSLFMIPLYMGCTVVIDPRVSENDFYNQITTLHPNVVIHTGSAWESFFNKVNKEQKEQKEFDFSFATAWIVGGEGTDVRKFLKWKDIIDFSKGEDILVSGYGASELFSAAIGEQSFARCLFDKQIISVGIPYAGMNIGIFNEAGEEQEYNTRGELWVKSRTAMRGYYNKPALTAQTIVDGWIHTGDLAEIDENGFVYIWGRLTDAVELPSGREIYLFDVTIIIKEKEFIDDAVVLQMPSEDNNDVNLVAHIVWDESIDNDDVLRYIDELNNAVKNREPEINLCAYAVHEKMLPYSPTTLKKDKNKMSKQTDGYIQAVDGELVDIRFQCDENGNYKIERV